jgi:hypothetical protein
MKAYGRSCFVVLLALCCAGCHQKAKPAVQQAQAPPLNTDSATLSAPKIAPPQDKNASPLASPLPPPPASAAAAQLPPPPPPKKVRHRTKTTKPAETTQTATVQAPPAAAQGPAPAAAVPPSPIGQLTTGDVAQGEQTKHVTADLMGSTQQGLNGIKRPLSDDEKVTAAQIRAFLKQAQQALDAGDTDGAHTLATKARLLLDELTKP